MRVRGPRASGTAFGDYIAGSNHRAAHQGLLATFAVMALVAGMLALVALAFWALAYLVWVGRKERLEASTAAARPAPSLRDRYLAGEIDVDEFEAGLPEELARECDGRDPAVSRGA